MTHIGRTLLVAATGALALLAAPPLEAQVADARWLPLVGCWQPVEEGPASLLCVRPNGSGVDVIEVVDGVVRSTQTLQANGQPSPILAESCTGSRSVEFSTDGKRLFTRTEQACAGDEPRVSTGLIAMVSPQEWVDVQAVDMDGQGVGWVRRYRPAPVKVALDAGFIDLADQAGAASPFRRARAAAAAAVDVDDVAEASRAVDDEAVRSWIAEMNDPFDLDGRRLLRLADAGVPESVIDVMVAVSYPDRFRVDREGDIERITAAYPAQRRGYGRRTILLGTSYWSPYYYSPLGYGYGYDSYGHGYAYGYGYGPRVIVVSPRQDPEPAARVVKGRGYTRGRSPSSNSNPPAALSTRPDDGARSSSGSPNPAPSSGRTAKHRDGG